MNQITTITMGKYMECGFRAFAIINCKNYMYVLKWHGTANLGTPIRYADKKKVFTSNFGAPTNLATQTDKGKKERSVFTWNWHSTAVNRRGPGGGLPSDSRPSTLHGHAHGVFMCMSWLCIKRTGRTKGGVWATTIFRQKREYIFSFLLPLFLYVFFCIFFFLSAPFPAPFLMTKKCVLQSY